MANLSSLPPEIVRYIVEDVLTPPFDGFRRILNLRLVNRIFDRELIYLMGKLEVLRHETVHCRTVPWHHPNDGAAVSIESGVLFLARYLLHRPHHRRGELWTNFSALLNHLVDDILRLQPSPLAVDGDDDDDPRRLPMLTSLCRHYLDRPGRRAPGRGAYRTDVDTRPGGRPWFFSFLFPGIGDVSDLAYPYERSLITARVLLGPPWSDGLDGASIIAALGRLVLREHSQLYTIGSTVHALIHSGNAALFRDVLRRLPAPRYALTGFDINDPRDRYLEAAVCSGELDMVRAVLDPPQGPPHRWHGAAFEGTVARAIRERRPDMAWFLLWLRDSGPMIEEYDEEAGGGGVLLHDGLREASRVGDPALVAYLLGAELGRHDGVGLLDCCRTPLEIACAGGHEEVARLLLAASADPYARGRRRRRGGSGSQEEKPCRALDGHLVTASGPMFAAGVGGHIGVADLLVEVGGLRLAAEDWRRVAQGVMECGQAAFLEWMLEREVLGPDPDEEGWVGGEGYDVLGEACVWGNADIFRVLDSRGLLRNRPVWVMGLGQGERGHHHRPLPGTSHSDYAVRCPVCRSGGSARGCSAAGSSRRWWRP
ncbi:hypothetical protein PG991_010324 [Apiospora marii]|uniref:F-box domain-containing protein n=1 Tax=Apiospora marii TaxID=335849 RepID=A0ABR1RK74_9PEZI